MIRYDMISHCSDSTWCCGSFLFFTLGPARFPWRRVFYLAHTHVSTPEKTPALIFEQLTLPHKQQNSGLRPAATAERGRVNLSEAVNSSLEAAQLWLPTQKVEKERNERGPSLVTGQAQDEGRYFYLLWMSLTSYGCFPRVCCEMRLRSVLIGNQRGT